MEATDSCAVDQANAARPLVSPAGARCPYCRRQGERRNQGPSYPIPGLRNCGKRSPSGRNSWPAGNTRPVRIACGEWDRVLGDSVTIKHGTTGVFLDPPYSADEHAVDYSADTDVAHAVREWAIANGDNPLLRIALCGYDGEHAMPESWECVAWKARGGYGSQGDGRGRANASRERIWFSPHCLKPPTLFESGTTMGPREEVANG